MNSNSQSYTCWQQPEVQTDQFQPENFNADANEFTPNLTKASPETVKKQIPCFYPSDNQQASKITQMPSVIMSQQPTEHEQASMGGTACNFYQMIYYQQPFVDQNGMVTHYLLSPQQWHFIYQNYPEYSSYPYDIMHWLYQKSVSQQQNQSTNLPNCSMNQKMPTQINGQIKCNQALQTQFSQPFSHPFNTCQSPQTDLTSPTSSVPTSNKFQILLDGHPSSELDSEDIALINANAQSELESSSDDQDNDIEEWERQWVNQCLEMVEQRIDENQNNEQENMNLNINGTENEINNDDDQYQWIEIEIEIDGQPNEDEIDNASVATADESDDENKAEQTGALLDEQQEELGESEEKLQQPELSNEKSSENDDCKLDVLQLDDLDTNDSEFKIVELDFD